MIEIPRQLQREEFKFILLEKNSKKPIEKDWVNTNNYKFNDKKLIDWISSNKNYGVLLGPGNLFVIDIDVKNAKANDFEKFKELDTFQILTGGGGLHLYFISEDTLKEFENETLSIGELKLRGVQVVGPNCTYTNGLTKYQISKDIEIFKIGNTKFRKFYDEFISSYKIKKEFKDEKDLEIGTTTSDTSRSGLDFNNLRHLIKSGLSEDEIFSQMIKSSMRWSSLQKSKQHWEYDNAKKSLEKFPVKESYHQKQYNSQFKEEEELPIRDIKILTEAELMKYEDTEHSDWIIENFFRPKTICILGGKRSTLKTWLSLDFAYSIANGIKLFDKFATHQGNVLYADRENSFLELKKRSMMVKKGLNLSNDSKIFFMSENNLKLDSQQDLKFLEEFIVKNKISFIIGDTFRRLVSFEENSADDVSRFFVDFLKPLCERTGVCISLLHHEKKGEMQGDEMDMLRGSSDLANYADMILQLTRKGKSLIIKQTKQRSARELEPFKIILETDEINYMKFKFEGGVESIDIQIQKILMEWVFEKRLKDFTYSDAEKLILEKGYKSSSFKTALLGLQDKGLITKGSGKFSKYIVSNEIAIDKNHEVSDFY